MVDKDKRQFYRELKRNLKKEGSRTRRRQLKRQLEEHPEDAQFDEFEFDKFNSSTQYNGMDKDKSRKKGKA